MGVATMPLSMLMDQEQHSFQIRLDPPEELPEPAVKTEAASTVVGEPSTSGDGPGEEPVRPRKRALSLFAEGSHGSIVVQLAYSER